MKLLELTPASFKYYREQLNNNENDSYDTAKRKMTRNMMLAELAPQEIKTKEYSKMRRNMMLAELVPQECHSCKMFMFGSLHFLVNDELVVKIMNRKRIPDSWKLNKSEYVRLNKELRIEGKGKTDLHKKDIGYFFKRNKSKLQHKLKKLLNK